MRATGIGSMPGEDLAEALAVVVDELPGFVHLAELPVRGPHATMTGRGVAMLDGLGADLQPAGWRLIDAPGLDQRRAASLLAQDLDILEEKLDGYDGTLKVQVPGPLTMAATVERPRGDRVLADHGARRDLAQSLAAGVAGHVADVRRRVRAARVVVQVDEPALPSVLRGAVPTASGFGRHRSVDQAEADAALRRTAESIDESGAAPVVHCCAAGLPVDLLAGVGFAAIAVDPGTVTTPEYEAYAAAVDAGVALWLGAVPSVAPQAGAPSDRDLVAGVRSFVRGLGYDPSTRTEAFEVTPACGLAAASPAWARRALALARTTARALDEPE